MQLLLARRMRQRTRHSMLVPGKLRLPDYPIDHVCRMMTRTWRRVLPSLLLSQSLPLMLVQ